MAKDLSIALLLDFYGELLTEKQAAALDLYYNQDLSLAEIAEPMAITRQGVRDFIKRGERQLVELEEKLGLAARFGRLQEAVSQATTHVRQMREYAVKCNTKLARGLEQVEAELTEIGNDL